RGGFLEKNSSPAVPSGNRCSVTGRSASASSSAGPTLRTYCAKSHLLTPGHTCRSGEEIRTSRTPSGPSTSSTFAADAMRLSLWPPPSGGKTPEVRNASYAPTDKKNARRAGGRRAFLGVLQRGVRLREPLHALVDLVRGHSGVGEPDGVLRVVDEEVTALDDLHAALGGRLEQRVTIHPLGECHPHVVTAVGLSELGVGQVGAQTLREQAGALLQ